MNTHITAVLILRRGAVNTNGVSIHIRLYALRQMVIRVGDLGALWAKIQVHGGIHTTFNWGIMGEVGGIWGAVAVPVVGSAQLRHVRLAWCSGFGHQSFPPAAF